MVAKAQTDQELLQEIRALRVQLQEAEETLNAIRNGEVDALVVNGPEGEQVFTLHGADHPYRLMVETMSEGAITVGEDGTIIYCNLSFAAMVGRLLERVIGTSITQYIADSDLTKFLDMMGGGRTAAKGEIRLRREDGNFVPVAISTSALQLDQTPAVSFVVTDLTEHKKNQELITAQRLTQALHEESESGRRRTAQILESITDSFIAFDNEWRFTDLNQVAAKTVFGRPREELLGQRFWDLYPEAIDGQFFQQYHEAKSKGHPIHFEGQSIVAGKWLEVHAYPSPDGLSIYMRDISERKRAEQSLEQNRRMLEAVVETVPSMIVMTDSEGTIQLFNRACELVTGYSREEVIGKTISDLFLPPAWKSVVEERFAKLAPAELLLPHDNPWMTKTGEERFIEWRCALLSSSPDDQTPCVLGAGIDITERREAEEALRKNEELLRTLVNSLPNASITVFDKDLRYLLAAGEGLALARMSPEEFLGKTLAELFPAELVDRIVPHLQRALAGESVEFEAGFRDHWYSVNAAPLRSGNDIYAVIAVAQNITFRKRAEEERTELLAREQAARSEAEIANRLKDDFLATVSHELRTPLTAILGWSNILRSRLSTTDADTVHGVDVIQRNALLQLKLIEDLLDVSRIVSGKVTFNLKEVDVARVIRAAVEAATPAAAAKDIKIHTNLRSSSGIIMSDANRLQQIVGNLLSNAIKFTPAAGRVDIGFEVVGNACVIRVSDTGDGIDPEFLPYVFERFRQENVRKRTEGGLGLGLAIVRHLVELHSGTVTVDSQGRGQGATFWVRLPLANKST